MKELYSAIGDLGNDPFLILDNWLKEAGKAQEILPDSMALCTVRPDATPAVRTVLYKGLQTVEAHGGRCITFFTNYHSQKARELDQNPAVSALFFWRSLYRQIRIDGRAFRLTRAQSEAYFSSRPRESQLSAWTSEQSSVISSNAVLQERYIDFEKKFKDTNVPCPEHWGGFGIEPSSFEFWVGRNFRLHDRYRFRLEQGQWTKECLAP